MKKADIEARVTELVNPIIEKGDFILWDVEYVKEGSDYYLRVFVDKKNPEYPYGYGGITIDECVEVSRELDVKLDEIELITDPYILEVSSPGLTRPIKKDKEFERSIGRLVEVKLYKGSNAEGRLKAFDDKTVTITVSGDTEEDVVFEKNNISLVRLAFEE